MSSLKFVLSVGVGGWRLISEWGCRFFWGGFSMGPGLLPIPMSRFGGHVRKKKRRCAGNKSLLSIIFTRLNGENSRRYL